MHSVIRSLLAAALCASALVGAPGRAAEFRFKDNSIGSSNLELRGSIEPGDFQRLQEVVRRHPAQAYQSFAVEIDSPGGDVLDAIRIAEFARDMFWVVIVKGPCASACFFVYAAAPVRIVEEGSVGVHRPHFDRALLAYALPDQARRKTAEVNDTVRGFLARNEVPAWVAELMFARSSDEVTWLTEVQLHALGERAPYAHELIVARCGHLYDAATAEEERQFMECLSDVGARARLQNVYRLIKGTPQWGVFAAEMRRAGERRGK
jgi:hypothetical protein